jgi:hypothetical protein
VENVYNKALSDIDLTPTGGMVKEAKKGLAWRSEFGRGGTQVGISRARDIVNGKDMSIKDSQENVQLFSQGMNQTRQQKVSRKERKVIHQMAE